MSFIDAVRAALSKYATFSGRSRRSEYWWFALFNFLVSLVGAGIDVAIGKNLFQFVVALALLLPNLAVLVRRLHDTNRSGWWILIGLIPLVGAIVLIVFAVQDSQPGTNRFGDSPKAAPQADGLAAPQEA